MTFYDEVGGAETFAALVHHFYAGVADDEPLRALYPEEDLGPAERRLRMFHNLSVRWHRLRCLRPLWKRYFARKVEVVSVTAKFRR